MWQIKRRLEKCKITKEKITILSLPWFWEKQLFFTKTDLCSLPWSAFLFQKRYDWVISNPVFTSWLAEKSYFTSLLKIWIWICFFLFLSYRTGVVIKAKTLKVEIGNQWKHWEPSRICAFTVPSLLHVGTEGYEEPSGDGICAHAVLSASWAWHAHSSAAISLLPVLFPSVEAYLKRKCDYRDMDITCHQDLVQQELPLTGSASPQAPVGL